MSYVGSILHTTLLYAGVDYWCNEPAYADMDTV